MEPLIDLQVVMDELGAPASLANVNGESQANCSPALRGRERFDATRFDFWGEPQTPTALMAREHFAPDGALGAFFRVGVVAGQLRVTQAMPVIDNVLVVGRELSVDSLVWQPGEHVSFNFSFAFTYAGKDYRMSEGRFLLNF